ncbi:MAG: elongation factor Ts [Clostridiaceae bacterium]|nr:elongation factor Ts [Clostridiaceae bacterium]
MITAESVKQLREKTGCGMMDCKKALTESNGDMERAVTLLREKGLATAAKKASRIASEGIVNVEIRNNIGVIAEVNAETDFVAKNDEFIQFVADITNQIIVNNPADVTALTEQKFLKNDAITIGELLTEKISKIGENLNIRRFARLEGVVEGYIHGNGRIGVLVQFETSDEIAKTEQFKEFAKDMAMQVAAASPQFVNTEDVDSGMLEKEKEILTAQALAEGKPEKIVEKIVDGRIAKFYKEICIYEQGFIKDPDIPVKDVIKQHEQSLGGNIKIISFIRFEKGEGIEKKDECFADEIANMIK